MSEIVSGEIMYSLAETICLAVDADKFNLYLVEAEGEGVDGRSPPLWLLEAEDDVTGVSPPF